MTDQPAWEELDDPGDPSPITELNLLAAPSSTCQWGRGCDQPATYNVCQFDAVTGETLIEGCVDADFCEPHAHAMRARIGEYET
jgi:hypothetical protein